jgi:hypothetical protein
LLYRDQLRIINIHNPKRCKAVRKILVILAPKKINQDFFQVPQIQFRIVQAHSQFPTVVIQENTFDTFASGFEFPDKFSGIDKPDIDIPIITTTVAYLIIA